MMGREGDEIAEERRPHVALPTHNNLSRRHVQASGVVHLAEHDPRQWLKHRATTAFAVLVALWPQSTSTGYLGASTRPPPHNPDQGSSAHSEDQRVTISRARAS